MLSKCRKLTASCFGRLGRGKGPYYPLARKISGPQRQSEGGYKEKCPCLEFNYVLFNVVTNSSVYMAVRIRTPVSHSPRHSTVWIRPAPTSHPVPEAFTVWFCSSKPWSVCNNTGVAYNQYKPQSGAHPISGALHNPHTFPASYRIV